MHRLIKLAVSASVSVQMLCLVTLAAAQPVRADEGGLAGQISQSETLMFGHPSTGTSAQTRVEALETNIFGQAGSGPLSDRLKKINQALGLGGSTGTASTTAVPAAKKTGTGTLGSTAGGKSPGASANGAAARTAKTANSSAGTPASAAVKNKTKAPIKLQPMTAKTDMPVVAPNRNASADPALPPVAPKAVMSPKQLLQLGAKRFTEGNYAEADSLFRQVLVHDPNNVDALYNLGALAERRSDPGAALNFYRTALTLKPADVDLQQAIASIQQQMGPGGTAQNGPFHMPQQMGQPLMGGVFDNQQANAAPLFNGTPMQAQLGQLGQQPLVGTVVGQGQANVTQPPIGLANVTQPSIGTAKVKQPSAGKGIVKEVLHDGISVGLTRVMPGPLGALHCPLCNLLTHW
jgi:hypothetical protein